MINRKKTAALMLGLTMSMSGTLMAAPADEADKMAVPAGEVDLQARIEALESQQRELLAQLEALKQQAGDSKEAKEAADKAQAELQEVKKEQKRFKLYGFARVSYDHDNRAAASGHDWEKADEKTNRRFYLNLMADYKINDYWTGHLQSETNQRYAYLGDGQYRKREDGQIQRIWLTGNLKNGVEVNVGRKWNMLGYQCSLLGATTDGIDVTVPITKRGLRAGAFYYGLAEYPEADVDFWGPMIKGPVAKNLDVFLAYAKLNKSKDAMVNDPYSDNGAGPNKIVNPYGSHAFVISAATNVARNLRLTADYVKTNAEPLAGAKDPVRRNHSWFARLDYKWTNPEVPHSFGAYVRYHNIGKTGYIYGDDSWGSVLKGTKGWTVGCRYVPYKNVVAEVLYERAKYNSADWETFQGHRNLYRAMIDFYF